MRLTNYRHIIQEEVAKPFVIVTLGLSDRGGNEAVMKMLARVARLEKKMKSPESIKSANLQYIVMELLGDDLSEHRKQQHHERIHY